MNTDRLTHMQDSGFIYDKNLTMCQDVTPNTSEGRSMMYAITWNNSGTKMIQVGIEPKRLIDEMNQNQISVVISNMPMYTGINIFVADSGDGKILGSTKAAMVGKTLNDVGISRDKVTEQADVPAICYRNIDGIVSRCAFDRTDDYIVVVTCNLLSNIKTDVIIMVIRIVYFIIAEKGSGRILRNLQSRRMRECMSVRQNTTVKREKTRENCRLHIMHLQSYILKYLSLILHRIHIRL